MSGIPQEVHGSQRLRLRVEGAVQGVGFRPFAWRLARELGLTGWVANDARGVVLEVQGRPGTLDRFRERLREELPAPGHVRRLTERTVPVEAEDGFRIRPSRGSRSPTAEVLPDLATCPECLADVLDPGDRRHGYPFTNCTRCGPRFTILRELPYDRPNTTMAGFPMCPACRREYDDPADRRFHAQPTACPDCGPALSLRDAAGAERARGDAALHGAVAALRRGEVVALKGLGGFHLMVDAADAGAVRRLRDRKPRRDKPLAVMVADLEAAATLCEVDDLAAGALASPIAPILLLPRRAGAAVAREVAPDNPWLGLMLPSTPLHHLLLREFRGPLVATSGNRSEEPICTDEAEAVRRLGGVADAFLVHDRPIARHADDSVAWPFRGELRLLRRARGLAPAPIPASRPLPPLLAVGAHLKNAVALGLERHVVLSQHIGDMDTAESRGAFTRVIVDLLRLHEARPAAIVHDLHPDYAATRWARQIAGMAAPEGDLAVLAGLPCIGVQHHHAHLAACAADAGHEGPALGVTWDGTGLGTDGTIWGGEFLQGDAGSFRRAGHLHPFRLPGGDTAAREPRRPGLALLWELIGPEALERTELPPVASFTPEQRRVLAGALERGVNAPVTTSAGRLFDGVAALLGLHLHGGFEARAAMALEFLADPAERGTYPVPLREDADGTAVLDWRPMLAAILEDRRRGVAPERIAARFHEGLAAAIEAMARHVGEGAVALTGGCFQNRRLLAAATARLERAGFRVLLHRRVPPNDGGIGLGQVLVAARRLASGTVPERGLQV